MNAKRPIKGGIALGHHQTEKESWGGNTNLNRDQRIGFGGPIMIGETVASNMQNLTNLQT
jgi:hypothetical protein